MPYPAPYPHDPIEEFAPDVFMVRGSVQMTRLLRITRNMAIVRHAGELSLINPIRLDAAGEQALRALGRVTRLLRLGPMHGQDDPYYVDTFGAKLWTPGESESYPEPKPDRVLEPGVELPFPDADLFCFQGTKQPECALCIGKAGGILLTCDSIQHYGDYRYNNLPARLIMPFIGFPRTTVVGPIWLRNMTPEGASLESEFRRLLEWEFDVLLSGHGSLLRSGANASVAAAVDRAFKK